MTFCKNDTRHIGLNWDIRQNETEHNDTEYNGSEHNDTEHNDTQHNDTWYIGLTWDTLHNDLAK
jgi:hypothetical protein